MKLLLLLSLIYAAAATPSDDFNDYRLYYGIPEGCVANTTCLYFVGLNASGDQLDIYLSAMATGWVAIGFSETRSMQASDVVGCAVTVTENNGDIVVPIDTYNVETGFNNTLDINQDVTEGSVMSMVDGRITCTFNRSINGSDSPPQDFNLDGDYFFLFGFEDDRRSPGGGFPQHDLDGIGRPTILGQFNPVQDTGVLEEEVDTDATVTAPTRAADDYRLFSQDPVGCSPQDCDYYLGVDTNEGNDTFLDFYLTGDIGGWVAVGLSRTADMFDADVLGCNLNPVTSEVIVVDTYNSAREPRDNLRDTNLNDIVTHFTEFSGGRITCVFSRSIRGANPFPEDVNLDRDYYFLFGLGDGGGSGGFPNHGTNRIPAISAQRANPVTDSGLIGQSTFEQQLLQAHGILMLVAWPMLAFTAIFFAAWMKPALPNGEWFQVHRIFHIAAVLVALVGFILAFVSQRDTDGLITLGSSNKRGTAHYVLGIIIMALQIANPIIAIFRCKPDGKYRWIFNLIHGTIIGLGVKILAYINIGLGVSIFSERESNFRDLTILWVYLAFVVLSAILNSSLAIIFSIIAAMKGEEGTPLAPAMFKPMYKAIFGSPPPSTSGVEMMKPGETGEPSKPTGPPPRKPASADSPIRWVALVIFLSFMVPLIVTVIALIAATGNRQ